jgi:sortase (surface protein transpeptidase)
LFGALVGGVAITLRAASSQDGDPEGTPASTPTIENNTVGEMPSTGALRPGPVGQDPPIPPSAATLPVAIIVEAAGIDAEIETLNIVDGRLENPTGPWVVAWYQQGAELGEPGNVLLAGHVDYWGVGPSVFYNVRNLAEGDEIDLTGEDGAVFTYAVAWNETIAIDDLLSGRMSEIVAPTDDQVVTLFTCGGEFDYVNGEYLSRTIVRGERVRPEPAESTPES